MGVLVKVMPKFMFVDIFAISFASKIQIMVLNFKEILTISLVLFAVIDVIGSVPIIIDLQKKNKHVQAGKATIVSGFIMVIFLFLGEVILRLLGIDIGSFAIAGAFVMFLIGLEMVLGTQIFKHDRETDDSASVVPIAFPLIAGAGTMTSLISLRAEFHEINILVGIVVNLFFVYIVLKASGWLEHKMGKGGFNIIRKIFGIILLSIAIKLFKNHWFL